MALNNPMDDGDSPIAARYAVRTTPFGDSAVRYKQASEIDIRGRPDG